MAITNCSSADKAAHYLSMSNDNLEVNGIFSFLLASSEFIYGNRTTTHLATIIGSTSIATGTGS